MNRRATVLTAMGFEIFGLVAAAVFCGRWLDHHFEWRGLATAACVLMALVGWLIHVLILLKQLANERETSHTNKP